MQRPTRDFRRVQGLQAAGGCIARVGERFEPCLFTLHVELRKAREVHVDLSPHLHIRAHAEFAKGDRIQLRGDVFQSPEIVGDDITFDPVTPCQPEDESSVAIAQCGSYPVDFRFDHEGAGITVE
jgi:hypothetical protein